MTHILTQTRLVIAGAVFLSVALLAPLTADAAVTNGNLIKCPNNPAVYYVGDDGNRYTFPNKKIYDTWYDDFSDVKEVTCKRLGTIKLKGNVPYAAGTRLLKIPSVPKVYAVESSGVLRPIRDEAQALKLFGEDWASRVDDLSEAFFPRYTVGAELNTDEVPEGTLVEDNDGALLRYDKDGELVEVDDLLTDKERKLMRRFAHKVKKLEERLDKKIKRLRKLDRQIEEKMRLLKNLKAINFKDGEVEDVEIDIPEAGDDTEYIDDELEDIADDKEETADEVETELEDSADDTEEAVNETESDTEDATNDTEEATDDVEDSAGGVANNSNDSMGSGTGNGSGSSSGQTSSSTGDSEGSSETND